MKSFDQVADFSPDPGKLSYVPAELWTRRAMGRVPAATLGEARVTAVCVLFCLARLLLFLLLSMMILLFLHRGRELEGKKEKQQGKKKKPAGRCSDLQKKTERKVRREVNFCCCCC